MSLKLAREVLQVEADAIRAVMSRLGQDFIRVLDLLEQCRGRIVTTGMGKSGIIARKIAATLASTGSLSLFLHPAEAIHGDLGMLARGDIVLALSHSGETHEILRLLEYIKRLEIPLIVLTGIPSSTLGQVADICLNTAISQEACHLGLAPTASTTAALALGDALAVCLSARKGFEIEDFAALTDAGVAVTVPDAPSEVQEVADAITNKGGGCGAIREMVEWLLRSRGLWEPLRVTYR